MTIGSRQLGQEIVIKISAEHSEAQQPINHAGFIQETENSLQLNVGDTLVYYLSMM